MQNLIDKLLKFKEKIDKATLYNNEFKEFIGIEVFEFIKKNEVLNNEFECHFKYLQNLSGDKDFIKLQDDIFDTVVEITKLTDIEAIKKAEEKYQALGGFYNGNRLKIPKKEFPNLTTLTELYEAIQEKNVYYRLGEKSYCEMGDFVFCHIMPLRNQYDFVGGIFRYIYAALKDNGKKDQIERCEILTREYDDLLFQLDEKIYKIPKLLHTKQFEDFFIFCAETYPQKGSEFWYNANKENFLQIHDEKRLKQIKDFTFVVIDDLVETLKTSPAKQTEAPEIKSENLPSEKVVMAVLERKVEKIKERNEIKREVKEEIIKELGENKSGGGNTISYQYNSYDTPRGKLKIGRTPDIEFQKIPATIIQYFYSLKSVDDDYKNYNDFNEFAEEKHPSITSNDFRLKIGEINRRICKENKLIKDLIEKGKNKKQEANIYRWNKKYSGR